VAGVVSNVNQLFQVSAADVALTSDDYYTPRWIFDAAGLMFDMDVSAPVEPSWQTCPARRYLTPVEDGLAQPWEGLVWMNPPYSAPGLWVDRFVAHRCGLALVPATRASWAGRLLQAADAIALLTVAFGQRDRRLSSWRTLLILAGCGPVAASAVGRVAAADACALGAWFVRPSEFPAQEPVGRGSGGLECR
jgi:hypothetical protein